MLLKQKILNLFLANTLLVLINLWWWQSGVVGAILATGFLVLSIFLISRIWQKNILTSVLSLLISVIVPLVLVYFASGIGNWSVSIWLVAFAIVIYFKGIDKKIEYKIDLKDIRVNWWQVFRGVVYLLLFLFVWFHLKQGATMEPVRSPWDTVAKKFFLFYFLASLWLVFIWQKLTKAWQVVLAGGHLLLTFSVANIVYPLGFGFDPFIHQATEKHILEHGFILPKKLYYTGQYVLNIWLHKISNLSVVSIDRNLLPVLAAILLPLTLNNTFKISARRLALFLVLLIPFSFLTFTTPQNIGYLLFVVMIFLNVRRSSHWLNCGLAVTTLFIHPIAGLATLLLAGLFLLEKIAIKKWIKNLFYGLACLASVVAFWLFKIVTGFEVTLTRNFGIKNFFDNAFRWQADLYWQNDIVHLAKSVAYFIWQPSHIFAIVLALSIAGMLIMKKRNKLQLVARNKIFLICGLVLMVNSYLLLAVVDFPFLIAQEKGDFAYRFFVLASFCLLPGFVYFVGVVLNKLFELIKNKKIAGVVVSLLIALPLTTCLYFSHPRNDVYYYERGFNTSQYDFGVIRKLEEITDQDYVVLANQQVGAGALYTFGFRYYQDKYFFYSIPTGGELYQIYHKVVYEDAGREEIKKASDLTGAKIVYVYFPEYWFNLGRMRENLSVSADEVWEVEGGVVFCFIF